jgi:hypothetical protein
MIGFLRYALRGILKVFSKKHTRRFLYLCVLGAAALADFLHSGLARRTFVFYTVKGGTPVVEDRMLAREASKETDLIRYVEEALLGPVSLEAGALFPRETRLRSLLYRDGVVYVDLSPHAALPSPEGGDVFRNLYVLDQEIRRNFSYIKDVRLFILGNEVSFDDFLQII